MKISAIHKFSMIDFPGKLCATIFTQGCNFRCPYCHNPELVSPELFGKTIDPDEILKFLAMRKGKLDGVAITGGEPTLHNDLPDFIATIKSLNFQVKLDTNGTNPKMLRELIKTNLIDYCAIDFKAPINKYEQIVRKNININDIIESLQIIKESKINYEVRTTIVNHLLTLEDIYQLKKEIGDVKKHFIQEFTPTKTLDTNFQNAHSFSSGDMALLRQQYKNSKNFHIR